MLCLLFVHLWLNLPVPALILHTVAHDHNGQTLAQSQNLSMWKAFIQSPSKQTEGTTFGLKSGM